MARKKESSSTVDAMAHFNRGVICSQNGDFENNMQRRAIERVFILAIDGITDCNSLVLKTCSTPIYTATRNVQHTTRGIVRFRSYSK